MPAVSPESRRIRFLSGSTALGQECRDWRVSRSVVVCPEHAILAGNLDDPAAGISHNLSRQKMAPHELVSQYRHKDTGEGSAGAHIKRQITGREVVAVTEGRLNFGTWEHIFCGEFDRRRRKRVLVKLLGE